MIILLGWYESTMDQSINGYMIKKGYVVEVVHLGVNKNPENSYVSVSLGHGMNYRIGIKEFNNRFKKIKEKIE